MSKAVMISIQSKWCDLIASGRKTIEVRKTAPKIDTPFKCYIYCTKDAKKHYYIDEYGDRQVELIPQKVIGEFVCDKVYDITPVPYYEEETGYKIPQVVLDGSCLFAHDIITYLTRNDYRRNAYGWHISNLIIYDTPKDLGEFIVHCKEWDKVDHLPEELECRCCRYCQKEYDDYEPVIAVYNPICYGSKPLTRPPQSWCYVEEV